MRPLTRVNFCTNSSYLFQGKRLLEDRKVDFNRQLDHLAEPIGATLQETSKEYAGNYLQFSIFSI